MTEETKAVVTITMMAQMVGLSRARFYQLQKSGVFPPCERDAETGRPFFSEELQKVCLEVRRRNYGVNNKPILFYARRVPTSPTSKVRKSTAPMTKADEHAELVEALQALGLAGVTAAQVDGEVKDLYPHGLAGVEQAGVIRAVFLHLRGKN